MTAQAPRCVTSLPITDLVTRAAEGDKQAWDALVERFFPLIWSICRKYRLGYADAEDVGQNVWLQLIGHLSRLRDPAALPGWLATVTRRECLRVAGARQRPQAAGYVIDAEIIADERAETAEQEVLAAERHAALREAFAALPPSDQRLIALLLQDPPMSYTEISARLDIPVGSIGPTRRRCLDKLRRYPAVAALINAGTSPAGEMTVGRLVTLPPGAAGGGTVCQFLTGSGAAAGRLVAERAADLIRQAG